MKNLAIKIAKIQQEIGVLSKDAKNPFFKSSYLTLNELLDNLKPLEEKHGVVTMHLPSNIDGRPALLLVVVDLESGETVSDKSSLPDIADAQKMGSAITYFRRYSLISLYKIQAEDDDGQTASGGANQKQWAKIRDIYTNTGKITPDEWESLNYDQKNIINEIKKTKKK